jgi:RNA-directed DNA polymerase
MNQKSNMHVDGESDGRTVPMKCPNKSGKPLAEGMEGRRPTKENIEQTTASQTQSWVNASSGLLGVREAAKQKGKTRFTALLHHVTVALLLDSFYALKRDAAPGVDGVTWKEYETDLGVASPQFDLQNGIHLSWSQFFDRVSPGDSPASTMVSQTGQTWLYSNS